MFRIDFWRNRCGFVGESRPTSQMDLISNVGCPLGRSWGAPPAFVTVVVAEPACRNQVLLGISSSLYFRDQMLSCAAVDGVRSACRCHGMLAVVAKALLQLKCALASYLTSAGHCFSSEKMHEELPDRGSREVHARAKPQERAGLALRANQAISIVLVPHHMGDSQEFKTGLGRRQVPAFYNRGPL